MEETVFVLKLGYRLTYLLIHPCFATSTSPSVSVKNVEGNGRTEMFTGKYIYGYGIKCGVHLEGFLFSADSNFCRFGADTDDNHTG